MKRKIAQIYLYGGLTAAFIVGLVFNPLAGFLIFMILFGGLAVFSIIAQPSLTSEYAKSLEFLWMLKLSSLCLAVGLFFAILRFIFSNGLIDGLAGIFLGLFFLLPAMRAFLTGELIGATRFKGIRRYSGKGTMAMASLYLILGMFLFVAGVLMSLMYFI